MALLSLVARLFAGSLALCAPLPVAWALASPHRAAAPEPRSHRLLTCLLVWALVQSGLSLLLLAAQRYDAPSVLAAEAGIAALGVGLLARRGAPLAHRPAPALSATERLLVAAHAALFLFLVYLCASRPITDFDSLAYHLPIVTEWIQRGGFAPPSPFGGPQQTFYPYTWEAICGFFMMILQRDDAALWPNLFCWLIFGLSTHRLARSLGASRAGGLGASLLLLGQPLCLEQVTSLHIDLPFAAFFVAGLYYALRARPGRAGRSGTDDRLWALVAIALLASTKLSALGYVGLLAAAAVGQRLLGRPRPASAPPGPGKPGLARLAVGLCALGVGLFFYAANTARTGNPLGFVHLQLGRRVLLSGDAAFMAGVKQTSLLHLFRLTDPEHIKVLIKVIAFYLEIPFLLLSVMLICSLAAWTRRVAAVALLGIACTALYAATPYSGDNGSHGWQITTWIGQGLRYGLPALGLFAAVAALGFERLAARLGPRFTAGLALLPLLLGVARLRALEQLGARGQLVDSALGQRTLGLALVAALLLAGLAAGLGPRAAALALGARLDGLGLCTRPRRALAAAALLGAVLVGLAHLGGQRLERRRAAYGATAAALERLPPGWPVGAVPGQLAYPLFGERLARPVRLLPPSPEPAETVEAARRAGVRVLVLDPLPADPTAPLQALHRWLATSARAQPLVAVDPRSERSGFVLLPQP
ncbi:MAG: hypothetical protein U1A78_14490 [Polyangia bacterium]